MAQKNGKTRSGGKRPSRRKSPAKSTSNGPAEPAVPAVAIPAQEPGLPEFPIVGMGASAGGLDAFKKFFNAVPGDSGIAFVLIPHLDPKHESMMVELLTRYTSMPVVEATNGMAVTPNHVYIIPPNKYMTIAGEVLCLTGPVERSGPQTSIDLFLRSLADEKQEKAICIILSGTGSHGTLGLKAIKAAGGMAMVQDPDTADYPAMPRSAIATDLADYVLPVEQMPQALIKYVQHYVSGGKSSDERKETADDLSQVLALVRAGTKLDFRHYRKKMPARRIERRMALSNFDYIADYLTYLRDHPDELRRLSRDLLISVTSFFRDPDAWQALATQVIAPLIRAKKPDAPIRVWCAGCATGEEPYSLGILILEQLAAAQTSCPIQIFATDIDDDALGVARQAVYPESISADVSPERLSRFFTRVSESSYQISKQLRETVIFARQNLINDTPFSKLDLVVCRNLLIYLEQETQQKVIELLHFALNETGWLFLGTSETIGRNIDLFEPLSSKWRIYRRIGPSRANNVQFPVAQMERRQAKAAEAPLGKPPRLPELAQNFLLRRFALACVVINRNYEVLHFAGPTEDYLVQPGGAPTHDLLALARPGLEAKLRVVIQRAIRENSAQSVKDVMVRHANLSRRVNIDVEPLVISKQTESLLLVAFQEQSSPEVETLAEARTRTQTTESDLMRQLEQELETTREDLQSTIEELETSNEELKASNEEIMSMNEELQSANEELETSKEELQSLNEELGTVNNQLHDKVGDLEAANTDMANFLNCTDIATIFLDTSFRIKRFTPASTRLFSLIATDVGRPLSDIARQFADEDLLKDAQQLLRDLQPREKEVRTEDGRWFMRRIVPYRTLDNRIDGVAITCVDVTERKESADSVVRRLATIVESSADAIFSKDLDGTVRTWNQGAERLYGYTADEIVGQSIQLTIPENRGKEWTEAMARLARGEHVEQMETERVRKDGQRIPVELTYSPLWDSKGKIVGISATVRDISQRLQNEQAVRQSEERLRQMMENAHVGIAFGDSEGRIIQANRTMMELVGWSQEDLRAGRINCKSICRPEDQEQDRGAMTQLAATGRVGPAEKLVVRADGEQIPVLISALRLGLNGDENVTFVVDLRPQKQAEDVLRDREARLRAILDTAGDAILTIDYNGIIQSVNPATERMFGYTAVEMIGQNVTLLMSSPYREAHDGYISRYLQTGQKHIIGVRREIDARRKDGSIFPTDLTVSEIPHLKLFTGIHRDLTQRKQLERDVVEIATLEQQRIGQDLHDDCGQELTALGIMVDSLAPRANQGGLPDAEVVAKIGQGVRRVLRRLRDLAQGLARSEVEAAELPAALAELTSGLSETSGIRCTVKCDQTHGLDRAQATHLYHIAQEACTNALRHGRAKNIHVSLRAVDGAISLYVRDDGIGIPLDQKAGTGMRIMRNRASILGAALTIEPTQPSGTLVTCSLTQAGGEANSDWG